MNITVKITNILICIFGLFFLKGCDTPTDVANNHDLIWLRGYIKPYEAVAFGKIIMATTVGTTRFTFTESEIDSFGYFSMYAQAPPNYLLSTNDFDTIYYVAKSVRYFSNTSALFYKHNFFSTMKDGVGNGYVICIGDSAKMIYGVYIVYSTENVSISGIDSIAAVNKIHVREYEVQLNMGWNIVYDKLVYTDSSIVRYKQVADNNYKINWMHFGN